MNVPVGWSTVLGVVVCAGLFVLAAIAAATDEWDRAREFAVMATGLLGVTVGGRMWQAGRTASVTVPAERHVSPSDGPPETLPEPELR